MYENSFMFYLQLMDGCWGTRVQFFNVIGLLRNRDLFRGFLIFGCLDVMQDLSSQSIFRDPRATSS